MVGGIYGGYSASSVSGTKKYQPTQSASANNYDYKAAQRNLMDQYKASQNTVQSLKADTAKFLDEYNASMKGMSKAAEAVRGDSLDKLLGELTEGKPTAENVDKTAKAIEELAAQFNRTLETLNKNADRGSGVERQIGRMVQSPTSERSMELIGITTQKDGTLKVDTDKLKTALRDKTSTVREVVGGNYGMAQGIARDSRNGQAQSPASLIGNDLAAMKQQQQSSSFEAMSGYSRSGAYNMMNYNSVGVLMNMLI